MTPISHGHRFSLHRSPTRPARISLPELSVPQPWASAQPPLSSHNCWAPRAYFPLPRGFQTRGKALNYLLHKETAALPIKQMLQEHQCHEIPQLLFPGKKWKSIPKAPVSQRETRHLPALPMDQSWSFQLLPGAPRSFRDEGSRAGVCGNREKPPSLQGGWTGEEEGNYCGWEKGRGWSREML